jgi:hypothetical protein
VLPGLRQKTHTKQTKAARARVGLAQKKKTALAWVRGLQHILTQTGVIW